MASIAGLAAKIMCIEDLPKYRELVSKDYVPFNLEIVSPAQNEFYSDEDAGVDGPALFSTRGTRCEKRAAPKDAGSATTKSNISSSELPHIIKIIAGRFRKDFALECKAIHENSWKHLSYYFDDLDIYHWGSDLLQQVLQHLSQENATLHTRVLRFAVHLLATDTPRARNAAYFGRANWFYEEIAHYGGDFLEETLKFMTHRTDVIEKLTPCATKYLEEAKGDSSMTSMWYDKTFRKLTEARIARFRRSNRPPIVVKQQTAAPLAPVLDSNVEKSLLGDAFVAEPISSASNQETDAPLPSSATSKKSSRHHRRTSSFDGHEHVQASSIRSIPPLINGRKSDTKDVSQSKPTIRVAIPKIPVQDNRKKSAGEQASTIPTIRETDVPNAEVTRTPITSLSSISAPAREEKKNMSQKVMKTEKVNSQIVTNEAIRKAEVIGGARDPPSKGALKPKVEGELTTAEDSVQKASPPSTNIVDPIFVKKSGNHSLLQGEDNARGQPQKKPDSKKFNGKRIITNTQTWISDPQRSFSTGSFETTRGGMQNSGTTTGKSGKGKKKGGNNRRRGSGMQDETRNASSSAEFSNACTRHSSKLSTSRSIFEDDDSIVSVTMNGKRQDSPNRSSETVGEGQSSFDPHANFHIGSNGDGFQETMTSTERVVSESGGPMPLCGPSPFPEFSHQPWPQVPMPPLNPAAAPYMAVSSGQMPPAPNQYIQWTPIHPQAVMHPVQHYGPGAESSYIGVMQHNPASSYHQQFDPTAGVFQPHNQAPQPYQYQHQNQYGRGEQYRRYPDDVRYTNDRSSYRRWNFPRSRRGSSTRFFSSGTVESRNDFTERMSSTNRDATQHAAYDNSNGMMPHEALDLGGDQAHHTYEEPSNVFHKEVNTDSPRAEPQSPPTVRTQDDGNTVGNTLEVSADVASPPAMQYPMVYQRVQSAAGEAEAFETIPKPLAQEPSTNKDIDVSFEQDHTGADVDVHAVVTSEGPATKEKPISQDPVPVTSQQITPASDKNRRGTIIVSSSTENQQPAVIKNETSGVTVAPQNVTKAPKNKSQDIRVKLGGSPTQGQAQSSELKPAKPRQGTQHQVKGFTWAQKTKPSTLDMSTSPGQNEFPRLANLEHKPETSRVVAPIAVSSHPTEPVNSIPRVTAPAIVPSQSAEQANLISSVRSPTSINGPWPRRFSHHYDLEDPCKLYISGLGLTDQSLAKISDSYQPKHIGPVRDCKRYGHASKPPLPVGTRYGFVTFASVAACVMAKQSLVGQTREGIKLTVRPAFLRGIWENATNGPQIHASPLAEEFPALTPPGNTIITNVEVPRARGQEDNAKIPKEYQRASSTHVEKAQQPLQNRSISGTIKADTESLQNSPQVSSPTADLLATTSPETPIVSDHPPVQGRLKKNKNKQKNKAKQQRKSTGNHGDRVMATTSLSHSRDSSIDQNQSFATSIESSTLGKISKDEADVPSSSNSNVYALGIKVSDQPYDMSGKPEEIKQSKAKHQVPTGHDSRFNREKHHLMQPPNSPVDVVMTDALDMRDAEIPRVNGLGTSLQGNQSANSFTTINSSAKEDIIRSEETFKQLTTLDHHSDIDSGVTPSGASLGRERQIENIADLYSAPSPDTEQSSPQTSGRQLIIIFPSTSNQDHSESNGNRSPEGPAAGSSTSSRPTSKAPHGQNDPSKGWDKSVKLNTKNSRKGRRKPIKDKSSQEVKTSIEMIHAGDTNGATNQNADTENISRPPEPANDHESA